MFKLSYDELNMMSSGGSVGGEEGELKDQPRLINILKKKLSDTTNLIYKIIETLIQKSL